MFTNNLLQLYNKIKQSKSFLQHQRHTPWSSCFYGRTRYKIYSACSTSSPWTPPGGAPQVGGRKRGKAHSRSGRKSSDKSRRFGVLYKYPTFQKQTSEKTLFLLKRCSTSCFPLLAHRRQTGRGVDGTEVRILRPPINQTFLTAQSSCKTKASKM